MCPLKHIPKLFQFVNEEIPPELRAQRILNKSRVPEITRYIVENPHTYIFSSITASIDGKVKFSSFNDPKIGADVGKLQIPLDTRLIINDGQHRRAAIEQALKQRPEIGNETISVVLFIDTGLKKCQQMFSDLNKHAIRPTKSINILYDHRDPHSQLARNLISSVPVFKGLTETEKATISNRSIKLFTLSTIFQATKALLRKGKKDTISKAEEELAAEFWTEVSKNIPEWEMAQRKEVSSAELRKNTVHAHGIALHALGMAGADLIASFPKNWKTKLSGLKTIDWNRTSTDVWEGRSMIAGRISKAQNHLILTSNYFKKHLSLTLTPEEQKIEKTLTKSRN
jgi:DNA sulfur modification protein DndB